MLAKSFKWVDETTLEFELRPGITFHNGDPFTADDVVYTINTVIQDKKVSVPSNYNFYESATKLDDLRVRVKLKRVFHDVSSCRGLVVNDGEGGRHAVLPIEDYVRPAGHSGKAPTTVILGPVAGRSGSSLGRTAASAASARIMM